MIKFVAIVGNIMDLTVSETTMLTITPAEAVEKIARIIIDKLGRQRYRLAELSNNSWVWRR